MQVDASGKPLALMAVFRLYQYLSNLDMSWQHFYCCILPNDLTRSAKSSLGIIARLRIFSRLL